MNRQLISSRIADWSAVPIAYYSFAHAGLGAAMLALVVDPTLPGASFYHSRMVAIVHLLTVPWLTGSILGAFYIVAPLILRISMAAGRGPLARLRRVAATFAHLHIAAVGWATMMVVGLSW